MSKISCEICPLYTACDYGYDIPCPDSVLEAYLKYPELCDPEDPEDPEIVRLLAQQSAQLPS